jgi:hypothetical protein
MTTQEALWLLRRINRTEYSKTLVDAVDTLLAAYDADLAKVARLRSALCKARDAMVRVGDSEYVPAQELVDEFEAVLAVGHPLQRSREWWLASARAEGGDTVLAGTKDERQVSTTTVHHATCPGSYAWDVEPENNLIGCACPRFWPRTVCRECHRSPRNHDASCSKCKPAKAGVK